MLKAEILKLDLSTCSSIYSPRDEDFCMWKGKASVVSLWKHPNPQPVAWRLALGFVTCLLGCCSLQWLQPAFLNWYKQVLLPSFMGRRYSGENSPFGWAWPLWLDHALLASITRVSLDCQEPDVEQAILCEICVLCAQSGGGGRGSKLFHSQAALGSSHFEIHVPTGAWALLTSQNVIFWIGCFSVQAAHQISLRSHKSCKCMRVCMRICSFAPVILDKCQCRVHEVSDSQVFCAIRSSWCIFILCISSLRSSVEVSKCRVLIAIDSAQCLTVCQWEKWEVLKLDSNDRARRWATGNILLCIALTKSLSCCDLITSHWIVFLNCSESCHGKRKCQKCHWEMEYRTQGMTWLWLGGEPIRFSLGAYFSLQEWMGWSTWENKCPARAGKLADQKPSGFYWSQ